MGIWDRGRQEKNNLEMKRQINRIARGNWDLNG